METTWKHGATRLVMTAWVILGAVTQAAATDYTVTKTADTADGACNADCSLREAIVAANADAAAPHVIRFDITSPASGVRTITLGSDLPFITRPMTIDGFTQPGSQPNTNASGPVNAVPLIEIDANNFGTNGVLAVTASNVTIRGLVINRTWRLLVHVFPPFFSVNYPTNVLIAGNFLGTTADGTGTFPTSPFSSVPAVQFVDGSGTFGGTSPADRNVLVGSTGVGRDTAIIITNPNSTVTVAGNLIGLDKNGALVPFLSDGIAVIAGASATIGGSTTGHRNVISGQSTLGDGGRGGIRVGGCSSTCPANTVTIQGNFIGTTPDGTAARPNAYGLRIFEAMEVTVGGTAPGQGNVIRHNLLAGVLLRQSTDAVNDRFRVLGNAISDNGGLGIEFEGGGTGPEPNDAGDVDGARQNYPVITGVSVAGGAVTVSGTLASTANRSFRLEFFNNDQPDPSGHGEGQTYLGFVDVTTNGAGTATFTTPPLGSGIAATPFISSTATDSVTGDTSEFSQYPSDVSVTLTDTPDPAVLNTNVTYTATVTNSASSIFRTLPVALSVTVPLDATFVSATGGLTPTPNPVTLLTELRFPLGIMGLGQTLQRQVVFRYNTVGAKTVSATVTNVAESATANNTATTSTTIGPSAPPATLSISGTVRTGTNVALSGVTLTLTGAGITTRTTTSAPNGTYTFTNVPAGSYVVTPSVAGRAFEPGSRTYTNITANQVTQDYVGRFVWKISGQVRDLNDTGVPAVTMTLSGGQTGTTTTDLNGNYEFTGIVNGRTVTVTPIRATFAFNPASQTFPNISKNEVAGFFVAQVGAFTRYFAEGATGPFFDTQIALLNATGTAATATLTFQKGDGSEVTQQVALAGIDRKTIDPETIPGLAGTVTGFSTEVTSDQPLIADRTMTWDDRRYGSHAETSIGRPLTRWFLAEGATINGFELFYLIQNPNNATANVQVRYLLPTGAPLVRTYLVAPRSRFNIWVNLEDPALAAAEVSADITSDIPVIVERAMYRSVGGKQFSLGHESAGVEAPALQWFFAEGATGPFFDLFYLIANPGNDPATVEATYLKPDGSIVLKSYTVPANSRFNIWVDFEGAELAETAMGTTFRVTNNVPVVIERAMWWAGDFTQWAEGHNTAGAIATGEKWGLAEGEVGDAPFFTDTYILVANTSSSAGTVRVTLIFDDGSPSVAKDFPINGSSRLNVAARADFPEATGKRFGAIVESVGPTTVQLVVERAMYNSSDGVTFAAGTSALGTLLRPGGAQASVRGQ
jgi:CSLREA domain-containing protein